MTEQNQIILRLKNKKRRISGMITPWQQHFLPGLSDGNTSSVAESAIGAKLHTAARKMRFVQLKNMGQIQPESIQHLSNQLTHKNKQYHQLLHINPYISREGGLWSKMEQVYPSTAPADAASGMESGILKQGSIIPKMAVFPKEGQSFSDFKAQMQSSEAFKAKPSSPRQEDIKPNHLPNERLFTRVQEFTQKEPPNSTPKPESGKSEPPIPAPKVAQPPATPASKNTVQRQEDVDSSIPDQSLSADVPSKKIPGEKVGDIPPSHVSLHDDRGVIPSRPAEEKTDLTTRMEKPVEETRMSSSHLPLPVSGEKPRPAHPLETAQPVLIRPAPQTERPLAQEKPILAQAKPILKKSMPILQKAKPVSIQKMAAPKPDLKRASSIGRPQAPAHSEVTLHSSPIVRREPEATSASQEVEQPGKDSLSALFERSMQDGIEHETSTQIKPVAKSENVSLPVAPTQAAEQRTQETSSKMRERSDQDRMLPVETLSTAHQTVPVISPGGQMPQKALEMILQKRLQNKNKAPIQVDRTEGTQIRKNRQTQIGLPSTKEMVSLVRPKPVSPGSFYFGNPPTAPTAIGRETPFAAPFQDRAMDLAHLSTAKTVPASEKQGAFFNTTAMSASAPSRVSPARNAVTMNAHPNRTSPAFAARNETPTSHDHPSNAATAVSPGNTGGGQVVQRILNDPLEDAKSLMGQAKNKIMGKSGKGEDAKDDEGGASPNLEKLAEDVFPYLKRLLEIEKDRMSGRIR